MDLVERARHRSAVSHQWWVLAVAALTGALTGLAVGMAPAMLALPVVLAIPVVLWRWPHLSIAFLVAAATEFEQYPYSVGNHRGTFTESVPFFRSVAHGMLVLPVELFLILVLVIWTTKGAIDRNFRWPRSPLFKIFAALLVLLVVGIAVGLSHGASFKTQMFEVRPWLYLMAGCVLAAGILRTRQSLQPVLWAFVIGSALKGIQGTFIFFAWARPMKPRPEAILGHEEAWFFSVYLLITLGLWLWGIRSKLRTTATWLLPFVLVADLANSRRAAWLILGATLMMMIVVGHNTLPKRRKLLRRVLMVVVVGGAVYVPAYWNHNGTLAQPARAVRSAVAPDPRDQSSDQYRVAENQDLILNIKDSGKLGRGFGVPIVYPAGSIVDISNIDGFISYIPHNGFLWVWLRMGIQGEFVVWLLAVTAIVRGCRLAKARDRELSLLGAIGACSTLGWVLMAYNDMGFAWFRIAVAMGCLLGVMEAANRFAVALELDRSEPLLRGLATVSVARTGRVPELVGAEDR